MLIRDITTSDNLKIASVIRSVLEDFDVPKTNSTYADASLDCMYESYNKIDSHYFVAELDGNLIGGAGIAQLDNFSGNVCELQKMYLLEEARGRGIGKQLIVKCLEKAKELGYAQCYLETRLNMKAAQELYLKHGFRHIDKPMGNTGHCVCPVWMLKDL